MKVGQVYTLTPACRADHGPGRLLQVAVSWPGIDPMNQVARAKCSGHGGAYLVYRTGEKGREMIMSVAAQVTAHIDLSSIAALRGVLLIAVESPDVRKQNPAD